MMYKRFIFLLIALNILTNAQVETKVNRTAITQNLDELLNNGQAAEAYNILTSLKDDDFQDETIQVKYGRALIQLGKFKQGEDIFSEILKINPNNIEANLLLAKLYIRENKYTQAETILQHVLSINDNQPKAYNLLGSLSLQRDKNITQSRVYHEKAIFLSDKDPQLWYDTGMIRFYDGDDILAKDALEKAMQLNPYIDRVVIGKIYLHYKHVDWAVDIFEQEIIKKIDKGDEKPDTSLLLLYAESNDALGNLDIALNVYNNILKEDPKNALAHAGKGLILLGISNYNYAATYACGINQEDAYIHLQTALILNPTLKIVEESLKFCEEEIKNVSFWRNVLTTTSTSTAASSSSSSSSSKKSSSDLQSQSSATGDSYNMITTVMESLQQTIHKLFIDTPRQLLYSGIYQLISLLQCPSPDSNININIDSSGGTQQQEDDNNSNHGMSGILCSYLDSIAHMLYKKSDSTIIMDPYHTLETQIQKKLKKWQQRQDIIPAVPRVTIHNVKELHDLLLLHQPVIITNFQSEWKIHQDYTTHHMKKVDNNSIEFEEDDETIEQKQDQNNNNNNNNNNNDIGYDDFQLNREKLIQYYEDNFVRVSISESGRFDGPENGTLWSLSPDVDVLVRPPQTTMLLGDFFELLDKTRITTTTSTTGGKAKKMKNEQKELGKLNETFYIEYLALHQYFGKSLSDRILPPFYVLESKLKHLVTNIWIGGTPTTSPLHYDDYENFLTQIQGYKEIILFPPTDFDYLYYIGRPKGKLRYEYPSTFIRDINTLDKRSYVFGSSVHIDHVDSTRHPLYQYSTPVRAEIHPGDTLYLPAFWHHEVQSVPGPAPDYLNIAVNYWYANLTQPYSTM